MAKTSETAVARGRSETSKARRGLTPPPPSQHHSVFIVTERHAEAFERGTREIRLEVAEAIPECVRDERQFARVPGRVFEKQQDCDGHLVNPSTCGGLVTLLPPCVAERFPKFFPIEWFAHAPASSGFTYASSVIVPVSSSSFSGGVSF